MKKEIFPPSFSKMKFFKFTLALTSVVAQYRLTYGYGSKFKNFCLIDFYPFFSFETPKRHDEELPIAYGKRSFQDLTKKGSFDFSSLRKTRDVQLFSISKIIRSIFCVQFKNKFFLIPPILNKLYIDKCLFCNSSENFVKKFL